MNKMISLKVGMTLFMLTMMTGVFSQAGLSSVRVKGNAFVTAQGETIVFKGVSTSDPDKLQRDGHWNLDYFQEIRNWGANIVRFPVHPAAWRRQGADNYFKLLDDGIRWAGQLGMYVIIDWHSIGNLCSELYQHAMYETTKKETFEFWRAVAGHYKDDPVVACFELFNEPTVYGGKLGVCSWNDWKALVEEMITIIRATGSQAVPLVAGWNWAYDLKPVTDDPIDAEGIGYVSHPYPQKRSKPWESQWTQDWGFVAGKYPVILTEIGFCGPDERGAHVPVISDESYGEAITGYASEKGISWVAWVFDPNWSPMLIYDWTFKPTPQGTYFRNAMGHGKNNR